MRGRPPTRVDPTAGPLAGFAHQLRDRRLTLGLTMAEVARRAGCSPSMLGEYERAERTPRDGQLVRDLAGVLDLSADALLADWGHARLRPPAPNGREAPNAARQPEQRTLHARRISVAVAVVAVIGVGVGVGLLVRTWDNGRSTAPSQQAAGRTPATEASVRVTPTTLAISAAAQVSTPATATRPSITVTTTSGLKNLDQVTIIGTGYTPSGNNVWIGLCAGTPGPAPVCDREAAHQVLEQVDASGRFSRSITLHDTFAGATAADPSHLTQVDCTVAPGCFISVGQANPNLAAFQVISFS